MELSRSRQPNCSNGRSSSSSKNEQVPISTPSHFLISEQCYKRRQQQAVPFVAPGEKKATDRGLAGTIFFRATLPPLIWAVLDWMAMEGVQKFGEGMKVGLKCGGGGTGSCQPKSVRIWPQTAFLSTILFFNNPLNLQCTKNCRICRSEPAI